MSTPVTKDTLLDYIGDETIKTKPRIRGAHNMGHAELEALGLEETAEALKASEELVRIDKHGKIRGGTEADTFNKLTSKAKRLEAQKGMLEGMPEGPGKRTLQTQINTAERELVRDYKAAERAMRPISKAHGLIASGSGTDAVELMQQIDDSVEKAIEAAEKTHTNSAGVLDTKAYDKAVRDIETRAAHVRGELEGVQSELFDRYKGVTEDMNRIVSESSEAAAKHGIKGTHTSKITSEVADAAKGAEKGGLMAFAGKRPLVTAAAGAVIAYAAARALGIIGGGNSQAQQM